MKLRGTHLLIALVAVLLGAVVAAAQSGDGAPQGQQAAAGFQRYDRADRDQYGATETVTAASTVTGTSTVTATSTVTSDTKPPDDVVAAGTTVTTTATAPGAVKDAKDEGGDDKPGAGDEPDDGGAAPADDNGGADKRKGANANGNANPITAARVMGATAANAGCDGGDPRAFGNGGSIGYFGLSPARYEVFSQVKQVTGSPAYLSELYEPIDVAVVKQLTDGTKFEGAATDRKKLRQFARALGRSVVEGGPLAKRALPLLSRGVTAADIKPLSGAVLTHCEVPLPDDPDGIRDTFIKAFVAGLSSMKVPSVTDGRQVPMPVVGAENTDTSPTTIPWWNELKVGSVDDVDTDEGKLALRRTLDKATKKPFGIKATAVARMPEKPDPEARPLQFRTSSFGIDPVDGGSGGIPGGALTIGVLLLLGAFVTQAIVLTARRGRRPGSRRR